ncbi:MAG: hypothetical protein IJT44_03590 [Clostridia bacterium]|nr:hypothetical protein [Clostridia bacterium]
MIKGVNRQVVEITQTDCEYFERILFLVKPEYSTVSEGKLRERAGIMSSAGKPPATRVRSRTLRQILSLICAALTGAGVYALAEFVLRQV